jgi:hypothetical protein
MDSLYRGLLDMHNLLRWVILIFLLLSIFRNMTAGNVPFDKKDKAFGLPLLISAHLTLLIGIYQWIVGPWGLKLFQANGGGVMKDSVMRFWAVEHPAAMLIAIILITMGYGQRKSRHTSRIQRRRTLIYYFLALVAILIAVPWPFREVIGRPLLPGMH